MTTFVTEQTIFNAPTQFNVLPTKQGSKFPIGSVTPSVLNVENWTCINTGAITITNFKNGSNYQSLKILGDGFTSIANNANIVTNTGAVKLLLANKVYRFTLFGLIWVEDV